MILIIVHWQKTVSHPCINILLCPAINMQQQEYVGGTVSYSNFCHISFCNRHLKAISVTLLHTIIIVKYLNGHVVCVIVWTLHTNAWLMKKTSKEKSPYLLTRNTCIAEDLFRIQIQVKQTNSLKKLLVASASCIAENINSKLLW